MPAAPTTTVESAATPRETCRACGGALGPAALTPRSSYAAHGRYHVAICTGCGAGTTLPRPTDDELAACYASAYGYGAHTLIEREKRYRSRRLLDRLGPIDGRLLDVGCMFGFLLDEAHARGLETWGVELSAEPAAAAAAHGHRVTTGTLEDHRAAHPDLRFDAIVAQHVVEHLPDPAAFFADAAAMLKPGGRVAVAVPNFASRLRRAAPTAWGWYQVPVHLHHFTAASMTAMIERAGLRVVTQATTGGDSLFLALTALQSAGRTPGGGGSDGGVLVRAAFTAIGQAVRPYYRVGDDELILIARRSA